MIVKCKANLLNSLVDIENWKPLLLSDITVFDSELCIDVGNEYVVYGILFRSNLPWYVVLEEDESVPAIYPAVLFDVKCPEQSRYWDLAYDLMVGRDGRHTVYSRLVFPEWANDYRFYEYLVNEESEAVAIFNKYKILIDNESRGRRDDSQGNR